MKTRIVLTTAAADWCTGMVNPADLRAFAERDWAASERSKREYWAECYRREGSGPARRAATALLEHARGLGAYPTDADRAADLAHHGQLRELLDDTARAITGR